MVEGEEEGWREGGGMKRMMLDRSDEKNYNITINKQTKKKTNII